MFAKFRTSPACFGLDEGLRFRAEDGIGALCIRFSSSRFTGKALRGHADALHGDAVGETKQVLAAAIARELTGYLRRATEAEAFGKLLAERLWDVRHVFERGDVL